MVGTANRLRNGHFWRALFRKFGDKKIHWRRFETRGSRFRRNGSRNLELESVLTRWQ
jgi:hypothetical protein